jgi:uncharacterized protein
MSILHVNMDIMSPKIVRLLTDRLRTSSKSILLLGPRQVGKSTLIQELKPDLSINLNDEKTYLDFASNHDELRQLLGAGPYKTVFIDEIQRLPSLLNTIQVILDAKGNRTKFYLTGSSARKLKRGHANLLPGRIFAYHLGPLCSAELNYDIDTAKALKLGCLPEPYLQSNEDEAEKLLSTYAGVYLKEEIQAEALTRNLEGFSRFINVAAESSGQILDFSKIAKQAKIERKICSRFYEILEDTLIAQKLEVYEKTQADIKKRPKFYFFDTGVLNGLLGNFTVSNDRKGLLFEHLVINQISASAKAWDKNVKLSYFRTRSGFEVDLIVETAGKTYAIEIKSGTVDSGDAQRLERFLEYKKDLSGLYLVCLKTPNKKIGKVKVCELSELIKDLGL